MSGPEVQQIFKIWTVRKLEIFLPGMLESLKIRRGRAWSPPAPPLAPTALHREQPQQIWADPFRISVKSASARDTKTRTDLKVGFKILNSKASSLVTLFICLYGI